MMNAAMERHGQEQRLDARSWANQGRDDLASMREEKTLRALKAGYGFDAQALGTRMKPASHKPTASTVGTASSQGEQSRDFAEAIPRRRRRGRGATFALVARQPYFSTKVLIIVTLENGQRRASVGLETNPCGSGACRGSGISCVRSHTSGVFHDHTVLCVPTQKRCLPVLSVSVDVRRAGLGADRALQWSHQHAGQRVQCALRCGSGRQRQRLRRRYLQQCGEGDRGGRRGDLLQFHGPHPE
jgi:hypothetical protein